VTTPNLMRLRRLAVAGLFAGALALIGTIALSHVGGARDAATPSVSTPTPASIALRGKPMAGMAMPLASTPQPMSMPMASPTSQPMSMPGMNTGTSGAAKPYNVAFARALPYKVLVTEMGMDDMNAMVPGTTSGMIAMDAHAGVRYLFGPLLHTGSMPHGVDVLPGGRYAFVSNFMDDPGTAVQIDLRTFRIVRRYRVGINPTHFVFSPDRRYAFVDDFGSSDVYRLDLSNSHTIRIGFPQEDCLHTHGNALSPDGHTLYVACAGEAWIYTIDTRTLRPVGHAITGIGPYDVKIDGPRHELWVSNQLGDSVTVLDERSLKTLATIGLGKGMTPSLLALTPDGRRAYVGDLKGNAVSVIDTASRRVIATVPVAAQPFGPTVTPDGRYVYEPSIKGSAVTIIRVADNRVMAVVPAPVGALHTAIVP